MPARYVEPPEPLPVQVRHDGRWLPGWAHGWRGERVFVRFTDPAASVGYVQWVSVEAVRRRP